MSHQISKDLVNIIPFPDFNHKVTLLGGQSFTWSLIDDSVNEYIGFTQDKVLHIAYLNDTLYWQTYPKNNDIDFIKDYFGVNINYTKIVKVIAKDKHVANAMKNLPNIRILNQPLDLTIISFIISANNNIVAIL